MDVFYVVNVMFQSEMVEEQSKVIISVCDFYFIEEDGQRFKVIARFF